MTRSARALAAILVLALVGAGGAATLVWLTDGSVGPLVFRESCTAEVGGRTATVSPEQAGNAATIAAVAEQRGLPARAVTIALAAAYQESDLHNLAHGDRDSIGLFQQRPSQGWGTPQQVRDPVHASTSFYTHLKTVSGWQSMTVAQAAQAVQASGFPDAYAKWEPLAAALQKTLAKSLKDSGGSGESL